MGKKDKDLDVDKAFELALKSLSAEYQEKLEKEGIRSMDDFVTQCLLKGIDPLMLVQKALANDKEDMGDAFGNGMDFGWDEDMDDEWDEDMDAEWKEGVDDEWGEVLPKGLLLDTECKEYHIRVKLNDAPVKIWRELVVPSNMSLELLAKFLIEAMGWENCHMHQFCKNGVLFKSTGEMEYDNMFDGLGNRFLNKDANTVALCHVLHEKGDRMQLEYDFGDSWEHDVWVKGIREYAADEQPCVRLLKGKGACPPEDCGGVWGYGDLLEIRKKARKTAEEKERLEWYGIDKHFDPEEFDLEEMQYYMEDCWEDVLGEIEVRKDMLKE